MEYTLKSKRRNDRDEMREGTELQRIIEKKSPRRGEAKASSS
jgi:hypothetical protein